MKDIIYIEEFEKIIGDIINNKKVNEMKNFMQHGDTNTFDHCYNVSIYCYIICKKLNWDYKSVARAGMLHDFFLYDYRQRRLHKLHAFTHGKTACENACKLFDLSEKEKDMIVKHMWPSTIIPPKSKEGMVLVFVDKYCAIMEYLQYISRIITKKNILKHV